MLNALGIEAFVVDRLADRELGRCQIRRIQQTVAASVQRAHHGLGLSASQHALHYQRIGDDETGEPQLVAEKIGQDFPRQRRGSPTRVERRKRDVSRHDRRNAPFDRAAERNQIGLSNRVRGFIDAWQRFVGIHRRPPVSGKMFRARENPFRLTRVDPGRCVLGYQLWVAPERSRPDDWIVRLNVDVAVRRVDPVDPQRSCFPGGNGRGATDGLHIFQRRNGRERRQRSLTRELLAGAALEIRTNQKRNARLRVEIFR